MDDDSDEYDVFDDIIFDEQTLATLDQQERKLLGEGSRATSTSASASEPANKRFKTNNGWMPGPGANIDYDEMPEISLQRDGSYGVGNPVNALTVSMSKLAEQKSERSASSDNYLVTSGTGFLRGPTLPQNVPPGPSTSRQSLYANNQQKHTSNRQIEPTVNNARASTTNSRQLQDQMSKLQKQLDEVGIRLTLYVLGVLKYIPNIMSSCTKKTPRYKGLCKMRLTSNLLKKEKLVFLGRALKRYFIFSDFRE
jgi:hypothetical protein